MRVVDHIRGSEERGNLDNERKNRSYDASRPVDYKYKRSRPIFLNHQTESPRENKIPASRYSTVQPSIARERRFCNPRAAPKSQICSGNIHTVRRTPAIDPEDAMQEVLVSNIFP
jgi:hypothetical protein